MAHEIVIVGLGPGAEQQLTRQAWDWLNTCGEVWLRTSHHPTVAGFPAGLTVHAFDELYDRSEKFEEVYSAIVERVLELVNVQAHYVGVLFLDGAFVETLPPGRYAFWKNMAQVKFVQEDLREAMFDVAGQDIMTADKVTLRMNAVVTYRVVDARTAVSTVDDVRQAIYREAQLALRAVVGGRELDTFLMEKEGVANELAEMVSARAKALGVELIAVGIRDIILPGEMKELMNRVTEAKKAAEANLIARREETAAMRSQANTARLLADNPTLMRLRELEVLEKVAANSKLNIVLGEKGLTDRVVNVL